MSITSAAQSRLDAIIWAILAQTVMTGTWIFFRFMTKSKLLSRGLHDNLSSGDWYDNLSLCWFWRSSQSNWCIVPLVIRGGQHKIYTFTLVLLYTLALIHWGTNWSILRGIFVSHNDTRNTMAELSLDELNLYDLFANTAAFMAAMLGDGLLVFQISNLLIKYS